MNLYLVTLFALIAGEPDDPVPPLSPLAVYDLRAAAVMLELVDTREVPAELQRGESFVRLCRTRWRDLADAPPLRDACRFPPREVTDHNRAFLKAYQGHLTQRAKATLWHQDRYEVALREVATYAEFWSLMEDVASNRFTAVRRSALRRLRDQLGDGRYYAGDWLDAAPAHQFSPTP